MIRRWTINLVWLSTHAASRSGRAGDVWRCAHRAHQARQAGRRAGVYGRSQAHPCGHARDHPTPYLDVRHPGSTRTGMAGHHRRQEARGLVAGGRPRERGRIVDYLAPQLFRVEWRDSTTTTVEPRADSPDKTQVRVSHTGAQPLSGWALHRPSRGPGPSWLPI